MAAGKESNRKRSYAIPCSSVFRDAVAALAEVNNEPGDPQPRQQLLLRSDGGSVTAALVDIAGGV